MTQRAIVNVATGGYVSGSMRLDTELSVHGYRGTRMFWRDGLPPGCPAHEDLPYAFKIAAMEAAAAAGATDILWCDASVWPTKPLDEIFTCLEKSGVYLIYDTNYLGHWCSDRALGVLGLEREPGDFEQRIVMGGVWGVSLRSKVGRAFFDDASALLRDPVAVCGPWSKTSGFVSEDPRVQGHRHDMPVLTALALRHAVDILPMLTCCYNVPHPHHGEQDCPCHWGVNGAYRTPV